MISLLVPLLPLLLLLPSTTSFLTPTSPVGASPYRKKKLTMTSPSAEGSVDAQALEIIAELKAGTKTM